MKKEIKFKRYYCPRKINGIYGDDMARKLAKELTETQREPTEQEKKIVKFYFEKTKDYQNAINELLGTKLYLMQLDLKTLNGLYMAIQNEN